MGLGGVSGDETRRTGGVQPALDSDFLPSDGSRAGEVWPADGERIAGECRGAAVGSFHIATERHRCCTDSGGALALVEAGDDNRVGPILGSPIAAFLAIGPARRTAAAAA